jgi:hypothetical protein
MSPQSSGSKNKPSKEQREVGSNQLLRGAQQLKTQTLSKVIFIILLDTFFTLVSCFIPRP